MVPSHCPATLSFGNKDQQVQEHLNRCVGLGPCGCRFWRGSVSFCRQEQLGDFCSPFTSAAAFPPNSPPNYQQQQQNKTGDTTSDQPELIDTVWVLARRRRISTNTTRLIDSKQQSILYLSLADSHHQGTFVCLSVCRCGYRSERAAAGHATTRPPPPSAQNLHHTYQTRNGPAIRPIFLTCHHHHHHHLLLPTFFLVSVDWAAVPPKGETFFLYHATGLRAETPPPPPTPLPTYLPT